REIGFESFEEYQPNAQLSPLQLSTGNIDLYTDNTGIIPPVNRFVDAAGQDLNANLLAEIPTGSQNVRIEGRSHGSIFDQAENFAEYQANAAIQANPPNNSLATFAGEPYIHLDNDSIWQGRVAYERPVLSLSGLPQATQSYTNEKAHTGKMSFKWAGTSEFAQNRLKLHEGDTYALQLWVSRVDENVPTFRDRSIFNPSDRLGIKVNFYDDQGVMLTSSDLFEPSGRIVEGWQKIEAEFEVPFGTENITFQLQSGSLNSTSVFSYLDDIRIHPLVSKMSCHVYDTDDYRLKATLDDDNFALLYHYDEAGNLYLIQKETVDGMRTIQESRGFTVER
ncbi:MAG: hypothetical protein AAF570_06030, partial [Bacteroidota bacterium]